VDLVSEQRQTDCVGALAGSEVERAPMRASFEQSQGLLRKQ
jgi:hypothetical protein